MHEPMSVTHTVIEDAPVIWKRMTLYDTDQQQYKQIHWENAEISFIHIFLIYR